MPDRKKVIREFENWCDAMADECPVICHHVLDLLEEQEAVEPFHKCTDKDFSLIEDSHYDYCPYCGKPITWAKQEGQ